MTTFKRQGLVTLTGPTPGCKPNGRVGTAHTCSRLVVEGLLANERCRPAPVSQIQVTLSCAVTAGMAEVRGAMEAVALGLGFGLGFGSNTQLPKGNDSNAAPAPLHPPTIPAAPAPKEKKKKKKKKKKEKDDPEAPAAPAKGKGKGKGKGDTSPRKPPGVAPHAGARRWCNTTPRSEHARRAGQMTKEEKARTPCMFYAFGSCKAAKCDFLHDDSNRYTGPPPRSLAAAKAILGFTLEGPITIKLLPIHLLLMKFKGNVNTIP